MSSHAPPHLLPAILCDPPSQGGRCGREEERGRAGGGRVEPPSSPARQAHAAHQGIADAEVKGHPRNGRIQEDEALQGCTEGVRQAGMGAIVPSEAVP
eukprot:752397-Hanusia_phi.AAC.1